ncbi:RDD family protein [Adhaeribacter pallidiroseus]|uniref:RDD domain-containing protein n=1 Tax=Adhaeribacter pallidiroseus TaxID=2072847 RepID=A0A369QIY7_9BACT|nr:RDD family protein [Adhaeribacter pallidiroseus]RDC64893.1 hypothetical protein AHMF7616_03515 [Adhaeribacter pallidiroseus]
MINPTIDFSYPSIRRRLLSYSVDLFIVICVFMLVGVIIDLAGTAPDWLRGFILLFMLFLYEPVFVSIFGGTLGYQLFRMRVVNEKTYENLPFLLAVWRFVVKLFFGWLSFLTATFNPRRRAIHDLFAGALMVQVG